MWALALSVLTSSGSQCCVGFICISVGFIWITVLCGLYLYQCWLHQDHSAVWALSVSVLASSGSQCCVGFICISIGFIRITVLCGLYLYQRWLHQDHSAVWALSVSALASSGSQCCVGFICISVGFIWITVLCGLYLYQRWLHQDHSAVWALSVSVLASSGLCYCHGSSRPYCCKFTCSYRCRDLPGSYLQCLGFIWTIVLSQCLRGHSATRMSAVPCCRHGFIYITIVLLPVHLYHAVVMVSFIS